MLSGPSQIGSTPVIRYRPDPGEPAARLSAPQQHTAGLVTLQEQRNETRLISRAIARGDDVILSKRTFTLGLGDQSPVFEAGLTTVVTRSDPNGFLPDKMAPISFAAPAKAYEEQGEEENDGIQNSPFSPVNPLQEDEPNVEEIQQKKQNLQNEDSRLQRNLDQARLKQEEALKKDDPSRLEQALREEDELEREAEEIEDERKEVELQEFEKQLASMQESTHDAILGNLSAAVGLLDVMFGISTENKMNPSRPALNNNFFAQMPKFG